MMRRDEALVEPSCVNRIFLGRTNIRRNVEKNFNCRLYYNFAPVISNLKRIFQYLVPKMLENGRPNGFTFRPAAFDCDKGDVQPLQNGSAHAQLADLRQKMTDDRYCLYTPRDRNLEGSFGMQAATLITVGSLSNRETVEEEERGRRVPQRFFPSSRHLAYVRISGDGKWSFVGYLISTWRIIARSRVSSAAHTFPEKTELPYLLVPSPTHFSSLYFISPHLPNIYLIILEILRSNIG